MYIVFVCILMRAAIPWATGQIASHWDFDLTPYHPLVVSYLVVLTVPLLPGIVGGFLLLESREEGTIKALLVAPTPLRSYVSLVCLVMVATAVVVMLVTSAIIGLALPPWPALVAISLVAAPTAPAFALLLSLLANNKVQAFAYAKLFGLGPLFVLGTHFVAEPWQWLAVIYPPYCACKAYWVAEAGGSSWSIWVVAGLLSSAVWVGVLQRVFLGAARR